MSTLLALGVLLAAPAAPPPELEPVRDALRRHEYQRAADLLGPMAEAGNAEARYQLGILYLPRANDVGLPPDAARACRLLVQAALLEVPGRSGPQQRHLHEPVKDFLSTVIKAKSSWVALEKEMPIEQWEEFYRESFLREILPLHDLYERAVKMKAGK